MPLNPIDLFDKVTPKLDATPAEVNEWRNRVAFWLTILTIGVILGGMLAEKRYAHADETAEIHRKLEAEISSVTSQVKDLVRVANTRAKQDLRSQLIETQTKVCRAKPGTELRDELFKSLTSLRSQYKEVAGEEFPTFTCADLLGQ